MTDLKHRDVIWAEVLGENSLYEIRTVEGFADELGGNAEAMLAKNMEEGRPLADAFDLTGGDGYEAALIRQKRGATKVTIGDVVSVEGRKYEIRHNPDGIGDELQLAPWTEPQEGAEEIIES